MKRGFTKAYLMVGHHMTGLDTGCTSLLITKDSSEAINHARYFVKQHGIEHSTVLIPSRKAGQRRSRAKGTLIPIMESPDLVTIVAKDIPEGPDPLLTKPFAYVVRLSIEKSAKRATVAMGDTGAIASLLGVFKRDRKATSTALEFLRERAPDGKTDTPEPGVYVRGSGNDAAEVQLRRIPIYGKGSRGHVQYPSIPGPSYIARGHSMS